MKNLSKIKRLIKYVFASVLSLSFMTSCGNPDKYIEEAEEYVEDKEYEEAIELYEKAIKIAPDEKKAYRGIINCYIELGENDKVLEYLEEAEDNLSDKQYERIYNEIVARNKQSLDTIHTAFLTASLDPDVVNQIEFKEDLNLLSSPRNIKYIEADDGPIEAAALDIMDAKSGTEYAERFFIPEEKNPEIMVLITGGYHVKVWIEGYDDLVVEN